MKVICGKSNVEKWMIPQISKLFVLNYKKYHYAKLTSLQGLELLLNNEEFDFICIEEKREIIGFAGFYIRKGSKNFVEECLLAHLLVDSKYRGRGLGTILEDARMKMLTLDSKEKVIYVSCVEKPSNSIHMKLERGFLVTGFRYHYREKDKKRENAIVLTNTSYVKQNDKLSLCVNNEITKKILKIGRANIVFTECSRRTECYYLLKFECLENLGRMIGRFESDKENGKKLNDIEIPIVNKPYLSIYVNVMINDFRSVDDFLIKNDFYPICYIPYVENYYGILEYQFLPNGVGAVLRDEVSNEGKEFIQCLI